MNATDLASKLGVSKARVSQYVSEGKLDGAFEGVGRSRLFDFEKVKRALTGGLDQGQMMGNGAATKRVLRSDEADAPSRDARQKSDAPLRDRDPDRYELARIQNAEEDARRKRRDNERDEGRWVLAEEVERATARIIEREMSAFDVALRDGAEKVADAFGLDFGAVRKVLVDVWRDQRRELAGRLSKEAETVEMSEVEKESDG